MAYVWQRWLADDIRAEVARAGHDVRVIEIDGWRNRGRPASTGHFDPNGAHTVHHTGATTSIRDVIRTLATIITGRPDLPGPLAQVTVAFNGDIYVVAAGRANHAGRIGKSGVVGMPLGADGNALAIGDEVDTNGTQTLPDDQVTSMAIVSRVVTRRKGRPVSWIHRHQDISGTGKWDIGNRTTQQLREDAERIDQEDEMNDAQEKMLREVLRISRRSANREIKMNAALRRVLSDLATLQQEAADDATKKQARDIWRRLGQTLDAIEAEGEGDEGGDGSPRS